MSAKYFLVQYLLLCVIHIPVIIFEIPPKFVHYMPLRKIKNI